MKVKLLMIFTIFLTMIAVSCSHFQTAEIKSITVEQAKEMIDNDSKIVVIDVRTRDEYNVGHISRAKNIDISAEDFEKQIKSLNKNDEIILVCAAGPRSAKAAKIFQKEGFQHIYEIQGGMNEWKAKKMTVTLTL